MRLKFLICAVALLVRVVPWAVGLGDPAHVMQSPDCFEYEQAALNLLDHHTLSLAKVPPVEPDSYRTPGYPMFIAGVYAVAGRAPHAAVLVQLVLAALSCGLLAHWGARVVGERAAAAAALVWALDVGAIANGGILLSETLCIFFMMTGYTALAPGRDELTRPGRALAAGLLFGCGALTRPAVLYFPIVAACALAVERGRSAWRPALALLLGFLVPCGVWITRNASSVGAAEFSSLEGQNLLFWRASAAMARIWGVPVNVASKRLEEEADQELARRGWPRARYGVLCKELAMTHLKAHPFAYLPTVVTGGAKAWAGLAVYDVLKHFGYEGRGLGLFEKGLGGVPERARLLSGVELAAVSFDALTRLAALALGAIGLALFARRRAWLALAVIVPALGYVTLTAGTFVAYYRFRLPGVPFWSLAVGVALDAALRRPATPARV